MPEIVDAARGRRPRRASLYELASEMLNHLRVMRQTMTEDAARTSGRYVNNTLQVATEIFDSSGQVHVTLGAAAGSIRVRNPIVTAGHNVVVQGGAPQGYVPSAGVGVMIVGPGLAETMPLAGHEITLYGTAGEQVCYWVSTSKVLPTS